MKFWIKIFLCSVILYTVTFDIGAYILVSKSYEKTIQQEINNSVREQSVIASAIKSNVSSVEQLLSTNTKYDDVLYTLMESLAEYYKEQLVTLELYLVKESVYSNLTVGDTDWLAALGEEEQISQSKKIGATRYVYVVSRIPEYGSLTLVYVRDISEVDISIQEFVKMFALVSVGVVIIFCILIYLMLKRLTQPIYGLVASTTKIAAGNYNERVQIHRRDEFGELGEVFNQMAVAVEDNIKELTKQSLSKQIFIDDLGHEMKTPMTSILGYTSLIMKANLSEEQKEQALTYIYASAKRLSKLSEKLLELANLTTDQLDIEDIVVEPLLEELSNQMHMSLEERGITLITHHKLDTITGDKELLMSVLINLVENGARASQKGSKITVSIYKEDRTVLEVSDEGCGMPEEEISKVLQPFYKLDKARTRENGGVGLGLSIVKRIVEIHGGIILIESKVLVGTTVKILL